PPPAHGRAARVEPVALADGPVHPAAHHVAALRGVVAVAHELVAHPHLDHVAVVAGRHVDRPARLDDPRNRGRGGRGLALARDQPLEEPGERAAHDLARLAHALELARALSPTDGEDEVIVEAPRDPRRLLLELEPVLRREDARANEHRTTDLAPLERVGDAAHRSVVAL